MKHLQRIYTTLNMPLVIVVMISLVSWAIFYALGLTTSYNDAMSHLNLSRLVFDNVNPGLSQIGGVWLPMSHVLPLLFIWNDWAWKSGFAGSVVSMISYVVSVWAIYKTVWEISSGNRVASLVGGLAFAANLNMIYLQSTPLTEPLYLVFFCLSALVFAKWITSEDIRLLMLMGVLGFLQVLTRYDGWFVVGCEGLLIMGYLFYIKNSWSEVIGKVVMFGLPIGFGVALWLLWNALIFGDPLFFAIGPYSARAQQNTIEERGGLITKGDWLVSTKAYGFDVLENVGVYVIILGILGMVLFLVHRFKKLDMVKKLLMIGFLFAPIFFNVLALFLGFSILNVPALNWNPSGDPAGQWFNVRYGILALPFVAVFVGLLVQFHKRLGIIVVLLVLLQQVFIFNNGIITLIDGVYGSSSFDYEDITLALKDRADEDDRILLSTSFFNSVAFKTQLPLKQYIHEGVSQTWPLAEVYPEHYADWVVMANGDVGEPLYTSLVKNQNMRFLSYYSLDFKGEHANVYRLKTDEELFVAREDVRLIVGTHDFEIRGVNSYDLAYKTDEEIKQSFASLNSMGINTVRFWIFGDGLDEGFQPDAGIINEDRFERLDFIITMARHYDMRLIPVFVNNWEDYGGKRQYLVWTGKSLYNQDVFFTDPDIKGLYKNYVNKVLSRKNIYTQTTYAEETVILAWDLINEPRSQFGNYDVVNAWVDEMAQFVKEKDENHLVMAGTETAIFDPSFQKGGSDACLSEWIDICSVHMYVFEENKLIFGSFSQVKAAISKQANYAHGKVGKPIMMGEIGISKATRPFDEHPVDLLSELHAYSAAEDYAGYLVWNWSLEPDDSYGFSPEGKNKMFTNEELMEILEISKE